MLRGEKQYLKLVKRVEFQFKKIQNKIMFMIQLEFMTKHQRQVLSKSTTLIIL